VSGWAFFPDMPTAGATVLPLLEVVGREIGTSLDQVLAYERGRELAVSEDRVARARDLHDGILQSLTGVRLELQALATGQDVADRARLLALERALALEQRELRRVIDPDRQTAAEPPATGLAGQLGDLARRMTGEWRTPISVRILPPDLAVPGDVAHAVRLLVHEAIVNALKHAMPSRVLVEVSVRGGTLSIGIIDDGHGFSFRGTRTHEELESAGLGPVSLRERVMALGGRLSVHSSSTGVRLEVTLPMTVTHGA
jgi:signal transduction histidine kinase